MPRIFISYRRNDSADVTGRIRDRLEARFGRDAIFTDVDSIPLGANFKAYIDEQVSRCDCVLAVIGPRWLSATDAKGSRRLDDPRDFVRAEVEAALARDVPVIPVLVQGASMPAADQLPASLGPLALRNGLRVRPDPDFRKDMDRLMSGIGDPRSQRSPSRFSWLFARRTALGVAGAFAVVALVASLWRAAGNPEDRPGPMPPAPRPAERAPDWRTASADVRIVDGVEYYEVDFRQGLTATSVCALVQKTAGTFATDPKVCQAFHPDASVKVALSGDRAVTYCTGTEEGICREYKNACLVCRNCVAAVAAGQSGARLYAKMFTTCR
jgi:hypothetical protein